MGDLNCSAEFRFSVRSIFVFFERESFVFREWGVGIGVVFRFVVINFSVLWWEEERKGDRRVKRIDG